MNMQKGFTLIELVVVIVVISILSAYAIPKFYDLSIQARISTINAAAGSMRSAADLIYLGCVVTRPCNVQNGPAGGNGLANSIVAQGKSITLAYGYPRATPAGIIRAAALDTSNYEIVQGPTGTIQVRAPNARLFDKCEAEYRQSSAQNLPYTITVTTSGC